MVALRAAALVETPTRPKVPYESRRGHRERARLCLAGSGRGGTRWALTMPRKIGGGFGLGSCLDLSEMSFPKSPPLCATTWLFVRKGSHESRQDSGPQGTSAPARVIREPRSTRPTRRQTALALPSGLRPSRNEFLPSKFGAKRWHLGGIFRCATRPLDP